jgi:hypothetical protein
MSSYMMVPAGYKRSLNLSIDFLHKNQRLYGYRTLNLLNGHDDDSLMSSVLYSHIASKYVPVPKANFVRVVINGEYWGVYANVQQFNKDFIWENFRTDAGTRWKVSGNPAADGGLRYLGEAIEPYQQRFTIKSRDNQQAWRDLIALCRTLDQTPPEKLEAALKPMLNVDGVLRFLALDVALVNMDGYWVRASDYSLYQDPSGRFHVIPADMNEAFRGGGGPPGGRAMRRLRRVGSDDDAEERNTDAASGEGTEQPRDASRNSQRPPVDRSARTPAPDRPEAVRDRQPPTEGAAQPADDEPRDFGPFPFGPPGLGPGEFAPPDFAPPDFGPPDFGPPGFGPPGFGPPGFGPPGFGPPGFGGPGGGGVTLDPLVGLENDRTPLRSKLLAVPALRARYLQYVREIAQNSLDWTALGPFVAGLRELIRKDVERDTRKLSSYEAFLRVTADEKSESEPNGPGLSLRAFAERRREFLLRQTEGANSANTPSAEASRAGLPGNAGRESAARDLDSPPGKSQP